MKTGPLLALFLALGCVLFVASTAHAQITTADLVGTVRDTTGGVVPGATVTLSNDATGDEPIGHHCRRRDLHLHGAASRGLHDRRRNPGVPKGGTTGSSCKSINAHKSTYSLKSET